MKELLELLIRRVTDEGIDQKMVLQNFEDDDEALKKRMALCNELRSEVEFYVFASSCEQFVERRKDESESIISSEEFHCTKDNVVPIGLILLITCVNDIDLFDDAGFDEFLESFKGVEGSYLYKKMARHMSHFFEYPEGFISEYDPELGRNRYYLGLDDTITDMIF